MRKHCYWLGMVGILLAGCVSATTTSTISSGDIPAGKYRKIVVFVENIADSERLTAEQIFASALQDDGVIAKSSLEVFNYSRTRFSDEQKAVIIRDQHYDAALYVTVIQKALIEEPVPDVWYDGQMFHGTNFLGPWASSVSLTYTVSSNGKVVRPVMTLITKSELEDVSTTKLVWVGETSASVNGKYATMKSLFEDASKHIVEKIRADHAI